MKITSTFAPARPNLHEDYLDGPMSSLLMDFDTPIALPVPMSDQRREFQKRADDEVLAFNYDKAAELQEAADALLPSLTAARDLHHDATNAVKHGNLGHTEKLMDRDFKMAGTLRNVVDHVKERLAAPPCYGEWRRRSHHPCSTPPQLMEGGPK
jgi:hypothetical protein